MNMKNKRIYCTGVYLVPKEVSRGSWTWIPECFEEDSFDENGDYIEVNEWSETEEGLVEEEDFLDEEEPEDLYS